MVALDDVPTSGGLGGGPRALSADGQTIVGTGHPPGPIADQGFRWTAQGGLHWLDHPVSIISSSAYDVSADGAVVVGSHEHGTNFVDEAFRWTAQSGMVGLGDLTGRLNSAALAVSADGAVVVGHAYGPERHHAFRWTADAGMVDLGTLPGDVESSAVGVSADGSIVVGSSYESGIGPTAFIWDQANGMRSLSEVLSGAGVDIAGLQLDRAYGISADGTTILGANWVATIPEPAMVPLLALAGLVLARRRRRNLER